MAIYIRTRIIILLALFAMATSCVYAQKSNKSKKHQESISVTDITPDPIPRKPRPDRHPKTLRLPVLSGRGGYVDGDHLHGIDVSHYQGRINWDLVARDNHAGYVYLKATEGVKTTDDTYSYNFSECKRVGLKVGSYLFFRPNLSAQTQFELFKSVVPTRQQDLLPLIDAESIRGVSIGVFQQRLLELCDLLEQEYGVKPLIYTGRNFYNSNIHGNSRRREYKYFIAAYMDQQPVLSGDEDYVMWQYSASGSVSGIRGNVDMSRFVGRHTINEILYKP